MKRLLLSALLFSSACAAQGRIVDVDPVYEPVQQVHQSFYRDSTFTPAGKRIAIMDFKGSAGVGQVFADTLAAQLFSGGFNVAERENVSLLLQEMKMAASGAQEIADSELLKKIGKMANVDIIIVGGVVAYNEEVSQLQFSQNITLPFTIWQEQGVGLDPRRPDVPPGFTLYRWRPGSYRSPAGVPVQANIYASARAIEVATGKIVWIDTVNVQTSGITQVTGLERLGRVMSENFAGKNKDALKIYIWDGTEFQYPPNWEEVRSAWSTYLRQQGISTE